MCSGDIKVLAVAVYSERGWCAKSCGQALNCMQTEKADRRINGAFSSNRCFHRSFDTPDREASISVYGMTVAPEDILRNLYHTKEAETRGHATGHHDKGSRGSLHWTSPKGQWRWKVIMLAFSSPLKKHPERTRRIEALPLIQSPTLRRWVKS